MKRKLYTGRLYYFKRAYQFHRMFTSVNNPAMAKEAYNDMMLWARAAEKAEGKRIRKPRK